MNSLINKLALLAMMASSTFVFSDSYDLQVDFDWKVDL
jgi:hypothetical protein